jgi:hypothetical protein
VFGVGRNCIVLCPEALDSLECPGPTLQRTNTENSKHIFPEKEWLGHSPNFHIHVSESDYYIPTIDLTILLQEICKAEAEQFPEKEYINGIFVAMYSICFSESPVLWSIEFFT